MTTPPTVYNYDPTTGAFLSTQLAVQSPLDPPGVWLVPANATLIAPPAVAVNQVAVFSTSTQTWSITIDDRGQTWYDANGNPVVINFIGDPTTHNLVSTQPTSTTPYVPPTATLQDLVGYLITAATTVSNLIVADVYPDPTQQIAWNNSANLIMANNGVAPTTGPFATMIANQAAQLFPNAKDQPTQLTDFANMMVTMITAAGTNQQLLAALTKSATAAASSTDLNTALTVFEGGISNLMTAINGVLPVQLAAPPAITIKGINA